MVRHGIRRSGGVTAVLCAVMWLGVMACGSDDSGGTPCIDGQACGTAGTCTGGVCVEPDGGAVQPDVRADVPQPRDQVTPPADVLRDVASDVPPTFDITPPPEYVEPDRVPPRVVSHSPADAAEDVAVDFVVRIEFSEPVRGTTVTADTFFVKGIDGQKLAGTITKEPANEPTVITLRPTAQIQRGTPYTVELTTSVQDLAGNRMESFYRFRFFTQAHGGLAGYRRLATKYSPFVNQEVKTPSPHYYYLTSFNFDADWDFNDNVRAIQTANSVKATVYYTVVETKSHFYINYVYFHPYKNFGVVSEQVGNNTSGAQVVVAKYPEERPIIVQTYSKKGTTEDILAYTTTESGITGTYVTRSYPEADLFAGGHYTAYLSADDRESCVWNDQSGRSLGPCNLLSAQIPNMNFVQYVFKEGRAEAITKVDGAFPVTSGDNPVGYALEDLVEALWPRRAEVDPVGAIFSSMFTFASNKLPDDTMRPGAGLEVGSRFLNPISQSSDYGRAPWAWGWQPRGGGFVQMAQGTFFLDPAFFIQKRFMTLPAWNPSERTGFSLEYCFNPFLGVDIRPVETDLCTPIED